VAVLQCSRPPPSVFTLSDDAGRDSGARVIRANLAQCNPRKRSFKTRAQSTKHVSPWSCYVALPHTIGCLARANAPPPNATPHQSAPWQGRRKVIQNHGPATSPAPLPGRVLVAHAVPVASLRFHHRLPSVAPAGASNPHKQSEFLGPGYGVAPRLRERETRDEMGRSAA
jgi:hypothetical protein